MLAVTRSLRTCTVAGSEHAASSSAASVVTLWMAAFIVFSVASFYRGCRAPKSN
jgi:hypothetical protein